MKNTLIIILAIVLGASFLHYSPSLGGAAPGISAAVASTSQPTIGTTAVLIAATSSCSARILTTYASPVMLTFTERANDIPTAIKGHLQAASTTVTYDSGQYGCDALQAYGFVSTVNYLTETR